MKKTSNNSNRKLKLSTETIRTLTSNELELVVGGDCKTGSAQSQKPIAGVDRPTC